MVECFLRVVRRFSMLHFLPYNETSDAGAQNERHGVVRPVSRLLGGAAHRPLSCRKTFSVHAQEDGRSFIFFHPPAPVRFV